VIVAIATWFHAGKIEHTIARRVAAEIAASGLDPAAVDVDGRDVTLGGTVPTYADRTALVEATARIQGVRRVFDARTVATSDSSHRFILNAFAGIVSVQGRLPESAMVERVVGTIADAWGTEPLASDLIVDSSAAPPPWLPGFAALVSAIRRIEPVTLESAAGRLTVLGTVPSELEREGVQDRLHTVLGDAAVLDYRVRVAPRSGPYLILRRQAGTVALDGRIGTGGLREDLDAIVRRTLGIVPSLAVDVDPGLSEPRWRSALNEILPLLIEPDHWLIEADEYQIAVMVTVDSTLQRARLASALERIRVEVPLVSRIRIAGAIPSADASANAGAGSRQ
jgi:hypothetical protein